MADRPTGPNAAGREDTVAIPRPQTSGTGTNGTGAASGTGSGAAEGEKVLPPMPAGQGGSSSNGTNGQTKPRPARRPVKKTSTSTAKTAATKPASPRPTAPPPGLTAAAAPTASAPVAPPAARPTATTTTPVVPAPVPVPAPAPAPQRPPKPSRDERRAAKEAAKPKPGRKARLRLTRVDPWSVMKTAFLLSIAFGIVTWVAVFIIWSAIGAAGVFDNINNTVREVLGNQEGADPFQIEDYINTGKVMGFTTLLACADVLIITALATLGSFLYNIAATLLGGLEVTLASED